MEAVGYNGSMARYIVHVRSPKSPTEAFAYMADLSNFIEWDPGVTAVEQVTGEGAGPGAAFDVTVNAVPKPLTLRYHTIEYDEPNGIVAEARSSMLTSLDRITVEATDDGGSIVGYDAELTLNGPLGLIDPLLGLAFDRIGDKAAAGLIRVLEGERVPA